MDRNFNVNKNITKLDRDSITELIDYIEVSEDKKITIHFKFMNELLLFRKNTDSS